MERRLFLRRLAATAAVAGTSSMWTAAAQQSKRKAASPTNPDPSELKGYRQAVDLIKKLPSSDPRSWKAQAKIHDDFCPHNNWWFLPWHRAYLFYFEQICRDVLGDDNFALPYWDWTRNRKLPAAFLVKSSPLWQDERNPNIAIGSGTAGTTIIRRILRSKSLVVPYSGSTTTDDQRESSTTGQLEGGPHNGVHGTVGGIMGTYLSPEDPIFWLHHCNIDRLWASWAELHGNAVPGQALWADHKLAQFYDPKQKTQVTADTSQMKNAAHFNAVYDRLETLPGTTQPALISKLGDFVLGTQTQLPQTLLGQALEAEAAAPATASGNVITFRVQPEQRLGEALVRAAAGGVLPENRPETYLLIEGVPKPGNPSTGLRVFLNPGTATATTDPGYAGTLAFFGDTAHAAHGGGARTFVLDVQEAVSRLKIPAGTVVQVSVVAVDLTGTGGAEIVKPAKVRLLAFG